MVTLIGLAYFIGFLFIIEVYFYYFLSFKSDLSALNPDLLFEFLGVTLSFGVKQCVSSFLSLLEVNYLFLKFNIGDFSSFD